jgi:hypothetical protein
MLSPRLEIQGLLNFEQQRIELFHNLWVPDRKIQDLKDKHDRIWSKTHPTAEEIDAFKQRIEKLLSYSRLMQDANPNHVEGQPFVDPFDHWSPKARKRKKAEKEEKRREWVRSQRLREASPRAVEEKLGQAPNAEAE